jgi:hypothetical protein
MRSLSSSMSVSYQVDGWPAGVSRTLAGAAAFLASASVSAGPAVAAASGRA